MCIRDRPETGPRLCLALIAHRCVIPQTSRNWQPRFAANCPSRGGAVRGVAKLVEDACRQLALPGEGNERIRIAIAAAALLQHLELAREDRELITRLGQVKLTAAEAALGASIMQSKPVGDALRLGEWEIFLAIRDLPDDRRPAAERVWQDLAETFKSSEHAAVSYTHLPVVEGIV